MTLVKTALDRAARECSVTPPGSWTDATEEEHIEIRDDFFLSVVDNVRDRVDLPAPIGKQTVITGTGAESYALPSDFYRQQKDDLAVYETTRLNRGGTPIVSDGLWTHINSIGSAGSFRYYKIEGYEGNYTIKFENDLATGASVTVSYVSDVIVVDSGSAESNTFDDDADVLIMPRRLIETGIVFFFRRRRGLDYSGAMAQYEAEISRFEQQSRGAKRIIYGPELDSFKPMRTPVPDYIPSS